MSLSAYWNEFKAYPGWLKACWGIAAPSSLGLFIALAQTFPDQPISKTAMGFAGKYGAAKTAQDYELYLLLHWGFLLSCLALFLAFAVSMFFGAKRRELHGKVRDCDKSRVEDGAN